MLWSSDSCQNRVSADQHHLTVSRAQVSTHRDRVFLKLSATQVTSFQMIVGLSFLILFFMKYVVFMCRSIQILTLNWPRTRKFSQLLQAGKTVAFDFSHHGHALRPIFMLWLVKIWQMSSSPPLVVLNWQPSKQDIRWPVSPDRTAGSSVDPSNSSTFLKLSADKLPVLNDRRLKSIFSNDSYEINYVIT